MKKFLFFVFCLAVLPSFATNYSGSKLKIKRHKYGVLAGLERGQYSFLELGVEYQDKKLKIANAPTYSINGLMTYHFKHHVLGYQMGGWYRIGRANLTYGANLHFLTSFTENKVGVSPAIGYKLIGFHFQTGYKFFTKSNPDFEHNTFFVSLRYFISQKRKLEVKK